MDHGEIEKLAFTGIGRGRVSTLRQRLPRETESNFRCMVKFANGSWSEERCFSTREEADAYHEAEVVKLEAEVGEKRRHWDEGLGEFKGD